MKKLLVVFLSVLLCLNLIACDLSFDKDGGEITTNLTKLPTPVIKSVENDYVFWEEVPNASSYIVKINDYQESAGNQLKYSIASVMNSRVEENTPTELHIYIKAKGNQVLYSDSEWSNEFNYTYTKITGDNSQSSDDINESDNNKGTYLNSGIGKGVDVVTAKNYNDYIKGTSVLDKSFLKNDKLFVKNENDKATQIKSSSSHLISDFVNENSVVTDIQLSSKSKVKTMYANIDIGLHSSATFNYADYSDKYYYSLDSYIERYSLYIDDYAMKNQYSAMFSNDYNNALKTLYENQNEEAFLSFFKTYGTHLIVSGVYGGRLNAYYSIVTNSASIDSSVSAQLKLAVEGGISAVNNTAVKTDMSASIHEILKTSEVETAFYASACGGDTFTSTTIDGLNDHYANWAKSFNESNYTPVLISYANDGLVGLWDILPTEYSSMSESMENAFMSYYKNSYNTFIDSYKAEGVNDYYLDADLLSCSMDNGYNYDKPDRNANNKHYSYDYEFGKFAVKSVGNREEDTFSLVGLNKADIYFRLAYDCDNLPRQDTMTARIVSNDGYNGKFYNMPGGDIGNRTVNRGLLVAYITYEDGTPSERVIVSDFFNGAKAFDELLIVGNITKPCKIEIAICIEFVMWAPGFLGISDDYWMNYRINKTLIFN